MSDINVVVPDEALLKRHLTAEATVKSFHYEKPSGINSAKGRVNLGKSDIVRGIVQIVKKTAARTTCTTTPPQPASGWC